LEIVRFERRLGGRDPYDTFVVSSVFRDKAGYFTQESYNKSHISRVLTETNFNKLHELLRFLRLSNTKISLQLAAVMELPVA
jgi:hypothetical protein